MEKQIRFSVKNQDDLFYLALHERVDAYLSQQPNGRYANTTLWIKVGLFLSVYWGSYILILLGDLPQWGIWVSYAMMGISGLLIAFNLSHDAAHDSITRNKGFNKVIYYLTFNALGTNAYLWKMRHNHSHHIFPNVDGVDADIDSNFLVRLSPNRPLLPHHRWQFLYAPLLYAVFTLHWVFIKDWHYLFRKNLANLHNIKHPPTEVAIFFWAKLFYILYMILLPVQMGIPWPVVLTGFLIYHVTLAYFFLFTNIMNHHAEEVVFPRRTADGYLPGSWAQHQVATCLDFYPTSRRWNFFFGGFNAHCAHHLFPHVCHVHYPVISAIIIELCPQYGILHKQVGWLEGLVSHFRHLKLLGEQPPIEPVFVD